MDNWEHKLWRNRKMKDVDFYVTNVTNKHVIGFWILRSTNNIIDPHPDTLDRTRVVEEDWKEVKSGKG